MGSRSWIVELEDRSDLLAVDHWARNAGAWASISNYFYVSAYIKTQEALFPSNETTGKTYYYAVLNSDGGWPLDFENMMAFSHQVRSYEDLPRTRMYFSKDGNGYELKNTETVGLATLLYELPDAPLRFYAVNGIPAGQPRLWPHSHLAEDQPVETMPGLLSHQLMPSERDLKVGEPAECPLVEYMPCGLLSMPKTGVRVRLVDAVLDKVPEELGGRRRMEDESEMMQGLYTEHPDYWGREFVDVNAYAWELTDNKTGEVLDREQIPETCIPGFYAMKWPSGQRDALVANPDFRALVDEIKGRVKRAQAHFAALRSQ